MEKRNNKKKLASFLPKKLLSNFKEHEISFTGGQVAYFFILSLFPFLIFVNTLIASLNIPPDFAFSLLRPFFPEEIAGFITRYISYINENQSMSLLSFGIVLAIFSASKSVRSLTNAFNAAYGVPSRRGFFAELLFSMLYILAFGVIITVSVVIIALGNDIVSELLDKLSVSFALFDLFEVWRWLTVSIVLFLIIWIVFTVIPDKKIKFSESLPGAIFSVLGFLLLTILFSLYVNRFIAASALYGSIGAVILLMLWMYFAGIILILGVEINSILEKEQNRDG